MNKPVAMELVSLSLVVYQSLPPYTPPVVMRAGPGFVPLVRLPAVV